MNKADLFLLDNIFKIMNYGSWDQNPRGKYESDGAPAHSKFITHVCETYHLNEGEFPIPTLMDTAHKSGRGEMLWIYQDASNELSVLKDKYNVHWWDLWDVGDGTIGQRYGATIKRYDLVNKFLTSLGTNPFGRRHIIDMLQYKDLEETEGLYPCAFKVEGSVRNIDGQLYFDMFLSQRSNDYASAGYINKSQYVSFQLMVVGHLRKVYGMDIVPGKFTHFVTNLHIYDRHFDIMEAVEKNESFGTTPTMTLVEDKDFFSYNVEDIVIPKYDHHKKIRKPEMAV